VQNQFDDFAQLNDPFLCTGLLMLRLTSGYTVSAATHGLTA